MMTRRIGFAVLFGILAAAVCVVGVPSQSASPSILSIDFGSDWMKGCLTHTRASSVGGFVDVVINDQSARKTPNLLGFDSDDDRVIGDAALALLIRTPAKVFPHVKRLIGAAHASQAAKQFQQDFPMIRMKPDEERNTILFERDGDEPLSVEEVIVQLLQVARQQAFDHLKATSPDPADHKQIERVVATVPEYFTTAQRTLYTQLIQLAGFDTPAQLNELTAVCIDFAVRTLIDGAPKQKVAILGSGSLGTSASLFEMSRSGDKITLKVLSTASDPMVGGFRFDLAIREQLIKRFDATQKSDAPSVRTNQRAMGKLLREARELKEMLSVSTSIEVAIEELFGGKDFKTTVTQEELHSWTSDLVESMVSPLRRVLSGVDGVTGIELFGGSIRGPAIQAAIKAEFPSIPLGKHIDTEESALLGAAHYAGVESGISKLIRVIVDESSVIPVAVGDSDWDLILSVDQQAQLAKKIQLLDDKAAERRSRDAARNALESALNDARDLIQSASSRASVSAAARATLDSAITAGAAFIDDADRATPAAAFDDKRRALLDAMEPVRPPKKVEPVGKPAAPRKKRDRRKEHAAAMSAAAAREKEKERKSAAAKKRAESKKAAKANKNAKKNTKREETKKNTPKKKEATKSTPNTNNNNNKKTSAKTDTKTSAPNKKKNTPNNKGRRGKDEL